MKHAKKKLPALKDSGRHPTQPIVGIGVIIWREDKVLLVKRKNAPRAGEWGLPGGKQKLGETIMTAAVREAREETDLDIVPLGIVTAIDGISKDKKGAVEFHYTIVEVAAESRMGKAQAKTDALEVRWATLDEVEKLCAWPEVARVVRLSLLQRAL
jgi:8-oxo-dGTP diphosphatase